MKKEQSATLLALTSSTLLLPAYQDARADAPPEKTEMGVRYSEYEEDDTQGKKTFGGSTERYEIDVSQFRLLTPVGDSWSLGVDLQYESLSGASPWFTGYASDGQPKVVMSGASIEDDRLDAAMVARHYYDKGNTGLTLAISDEDDYESWAITIDSSVNSADNQTTYSAAFSYSDDDIEPTQGAIPVDVTSENKEIYSLFGGISRIINKRMIVRAGASFTYLDGYLTDPYKGNDNRPDEREQITISGGMRYFVTPFNAALHADYRYYDDDWEIKSHTLTVAWHQHVGQHIQVIPTLRYYTQDEAKFFGVVADTSRRYYADDYRLSAFGSFSYGLSLRATFDDWTVIVSGERYKTDESWGVFSGDESPALVQFTRWTVGLDYEF